MRSIQQAARDAAHGPAPLPHHFSTWRTTLSTAEGDFATPERHNLVTNSGNDWLARAMGMGCSFTFATAAGTATASSATTLTNSGASFPTAGLGLAGQIVFVGANSSGTGSTVYGRISSNSSTVLTVDEWYSPTSATGAAGTTPNATGQYLIAPGQSPAEWMAVTASSFTPNATDTTLVGESTSGGTARAVGTFAHTTGTTTYTLIHLWTSTATITINNEAQFTACNTTGAGTMVFESVEPSPPTLVSGDTLQNTVTCTV
jgi:hypothetical protein